MRFRSLLLVTAGAVALVGVYFAVTFVQVWQASNSDDASGWTDDEPGGDAAGRPSADAIVVLGAAQYDGRPSPVLEARLTRALELYEAGAAPLVVTTGANQPGDRFTQGFAGFRWLREQGVPESAIVVITDGQNTYEELSATAAALRARGSGEQVVLVSDRYHHLRASEIAAEVGLDPAFSPADTPSSTRRLLKESAGVAVGRIVGFRRVSAWS